MSNENEAQEVKLVTTDEINPATGVNFTAEEAEAHNLAAQEAAGAGNGTASKRPKKLAKGIDGTKVVITVLDGEKGEMVFDSAELPEAIKEKLVPFGLGHKLGDAAAGRNGKDAEEAIQKVWDGIKSGDWSTRAPATPKVSMSDITAGLANMGEEERAQAEALLRQMGILK